MSSLADALLAKVREAAKTPPISVTREEVMLLAMLKNALTEGAPNKKRQSTNALRMSVKEIGAQIEVGGSTPHPKGFVNYAAATNNPWTSPRWKGRQNPNEGWADAITVYYCNIFAAQYGYTVVME